MYKQSTQWLIPIILAIAAVGALWYYWAKVSEPPPEPSPPPPAVNVEPEALPGPLHPIPDMESGISEQPALVPLPALDQSDEYFKLGLIDVFGDAIGAMLIDSGMIEKIVATVDSLPRAHVAERIRPIGKFTDQFRIEGQDGSGAYAVSDSNYDRYDVLIETLSVADLHEMTDLYRRFYPLFQSAYENLGYPNGYFNDRLVEVIDHLLESPEPQGPISLVRPHVLFEYADESLESLSSGQKMMIRMGSEHAATVKQALRQLRQMVTEMR